MYLLFNKSLQKIMGDDARKNFKDFGLEISPDFQYKLGDEMLTIAKVTDEVKAEKYIKHPHCEVLTLEEANAKIDELYEEDYFVEEETLYNIDINEKVKDKKLDLSKMNKTMGKKESLKHLYNNGVLGIKKSKPAKKFE